MIRHLMETLFKHILQFLSLYNNLTLGMSLNCLVIFTFSQISTSFTSCREVTIFVLITLSQWTLAVISYVILYGFRTCFFNTANEISISIECLTLPKCFFRYDRFYTINFDCLITIQFFIIFIHLLDFLYY